MSELISTLNPYELLKKEQEKHDKVLVDFNIIDFEFLCEKNKTYKTYTSDNADLFYSDDFYAKSFDNITQKFYIDLVQKIDLPFKINIKSDKNINKLSASIQTLRPFTYYDDLKKDIMQSIYKTMVRYKILILRLDKKLDSTIDALIKDFKERNEFSDKDFDLAAGVEPIQHKNDEAIFHKEIYVTQIQDEGAYTNPITKDDLLFEYVYRVLGREGRNLRGELIELDPVKPINNPFELKDDSIYAIEYEDRIKYHARNYGFLKKDQRGYFISNIIQVSQVDLKNTGSIKTNIIEDTTVEVLYNDVIDDAIKSGIVSIKSSNVKVSGSVGATKLEAKNLEIQGVTHKKSNISSNNAYIKTHKGKLVAQNVYIENLENGLVRAKNVYVKNCLSSSIEAENIYIENLLQNNKIYPKQNLIIDSKMKNSNIIQINPVYVLKENNTENEYEELKNIYDKIEKELSNIDANMKNLYQYLVSNQIRILRYKKEKERNNSISELSEKIVAGYEGNVTKYNNFVKKYEKILNLRHKLEKKISFFDDMVFEVSIYIITRDISDDNILSFYIQGNKHLEIKKELSPLDTDKKIMLKSDELSKNYIYANRNYSEIELQRLKDSIKNKNFT